MSKTKIQIKSLFGKLLFEHESEDNTVLKALREAIKNGANLSGANLSRADLSRADLSGANLYCANLYGADLSGADLSGADLSGANLSGADLSGANLYCANLSGANLSRADLSGADLSGANLSGADLSGANLYGADLSRANLYGANLSGAKNAEQVIASTRVCPEGDIIGYKKCQEGVIVKLLIPKEAKRNNAFGRKCRAEFADVLEISDNRTIAYSTNESSFTYEVGKRVFPKETFDENWMNECSTGIHFFITKTEAENY